MNSSTRQSGDSRRPDPNVPEADAKLRRMLMFIGEKVNVKTTWNSDFTGLFGGFDNHMNLILKDAQEIRRHRPNRREAMPLNMAAAANAESDGSSSPSEQPDQNTESGTATVEKSAKTKNDHESAKTKIVYEARHVGLVVFRGNWIMSITSNVKQEESAPRSRDRPETSRPAVRTPQRGFRY